MTSTGTLTTRYHHIFTSHGEDGSSCLFMKCNMIRSRDSDGSASRGSQEREYRRSDDKAQSSDRPFRTSDSREERRGDNDRNGEYDGPSGMQPDGLIEVLILLLFSACVQLTPFGWYSFYRPTKGRRLSRPGWLVTYQNKVPPLRVEPGHGHPSQY